MLNLNTIYPQLLIIICKAYYSQIAILKLDDVHHTVLFVYKHDICVLRVIMYVELHDIAVPLYTVR